MDGAAFFITSRGEVIVRADARNHFELLAGHLEIDLSRTEELAHFPARYDEWCRAEQPRLGRVGVRGGRMDLLALTLPVDAAPSGAEFAPQEVDRSVWQHVLGRVIRALEGGPAASERVVRVEPCGHHQARIADMGLQETRPPS